MPEPTSRPDLPWWAWVLVLGGAAVLAYWLVGFLFRALAWGIRTAFWVVVVGGLIYLVLLLTGHAPGRRRG